MANIFVQPNIGRHSYFVVCDVNTWTGNVSELTHWTDLGGELARALGEAETEHWISSKCLESKI